jgi:hypothetical protein
MENGWHSLGSRKKQSSRAAGADELQAEAFFCSSRKLTPNLVYAQGQVYLTSPLEIRKKKS